MIFSIEQEREIISKYNLGRSIRNIASEYGRSASAVHNVLKRNNIDRRTSYEFSSKYETNHNGFSDAGEKTYYFAGLILAKDAEIYMNRKYNKAMTILGLN